VQTRQPMTAALLRSATLTLATPCRERRATESNARRATHADPYTRREPGGRLPKVDNWLPASKAISSDREQSGEDIGKRIAGGSSIGPVLPTTGLLVSNIRLGDFLGLDRAAVTAGARGRLATLHARRLGATLGATGLLECVVI